MFVFKENFHLKCRLFILFRRRLLEICLVLDLQNQFRRASCVCRKEAEASMVLLDYGNLIFVKFSNIRKLPKCLAFPTFAIKCNVIGLLK